MRRFLVPLVFVFLLTLAVVAPISANTPDDAPTHSGQGCSSA